MKTPGSITYLGKKITFDGWYFYVEGYGSAFSNLSRAKRHIKEGK